ncbi:MAG TPA: patatin-like protein [Thermoanaerobaculia bacterium]|jgi:predicted acylesterase/phospholipase RssA|nr:patatin-like protein [Thermoanaerobaculia bacterium]
MSQRSVCVAAVRMTGIRRTEKESGARVRPIVDAMDAQTQEACMSRLRTVVAAALIGIGLAGFARPIEAQEAPSPEATAAGETQELTRTGDAGLVREVRLALVCYGGSSLAIYIHGNAKELHRLVLASKALQIDALYNSAEMQNYMADLSHTVKPEAGAEGRKLIGSTRVWYDRLLDVWFKDKKRVRTRVVVDVIAGTSAGGINGVILAKALAHDLSQDGLTELWMEKASLRRLTDNYFGFFRIFSGGAPINGKALAGWLYEALDGMDRQAMRRTKNRSLLPRGDRLDLFVTTTDLYGYPQQVVIDNPSLAAEKHFPHVLHFIYSGENRGCAQISGKDGILDDFCPEWTPAMAFAARASSSIPGVFPPLNLGETLAQLKPASDKQIPRAAPPASENVVVQRLFRNFQLQEPKRESTYATDTYFVDGGVLDNHPFGPAIAEILRRPQDQEVRRFLLYLQPDPGKPPTAHPKGRPPGLLNTVMAGLSGIPSQQPILNELNDVAAYNEKVRRIRDIVHSEETATRAFEKLEKEGKTSADCQNVLSLTVSQRFGCAVGFSPGNLETELVHADQASLRKAREAVEEKADQGVTEFAGRSYYSLRIHSVLDQFVDVIASEQVNNFPPESAHRALLARIIARWAEKRGLINDPESPENAQDPFEQEKLQREFLKDFDVGYQRRQLRFVTDWINGQYTAEPPPTQQERKALDKIKAAAAKRINELTQLEVGNAPDPQLTEQLGSLRTLFEKLSPWPAADGKALTIRELADNFVDEHTNPMNLAALDLARKSLGAALRRLQQKVRDESFEDFNTMGLALPARKRQEILIRYFGFPFWDRQIYPLTAFSDLGEFAEIGIVRLSPDDATLLGGGDAKHKLVGAGKAHFGAFLSRSGRESDYVWGRLDAAERLLTVLGISGQGAGELFRSIVNEVRATEGNLIRESILKERELDIDRHFPH